MTLNKLYYVVSTSNNPYYNLGLEEYLLDHVKPGTCMLYLWQNQKTVVIGANQNPWKECRIKELEKDGGHLARRLSGGGAVFHDLGNLNFTFLARKPDFNKERQSEVILSAVQSFGICPQRSGRNDLTLDGRKFSGTAYYERGSSCYHHGTLMLKIDKEQMSSYLSVSQEKLASKGVDSVKSRVVNLTEYVPELTAAQMKEALIEAFGQVYGYKPEPLPLEWIAKEEVLQRQEFFGSWEWLYGRKIPFQYEETHRFSWGEVLVQLDVAEGVVRQAAVWSDCLDTEFPKAAQEAFLGTRYGSEDWKGLPEQMEDETRAGYMADLLSLFT